MNAASQCTEWNPNPYQVSKGAPIQCLNCGGHWDAHSLSGLSKTAAVPKVMVKFPQPGQPRNYVVGGGGHVAGGGGICKAFALGTRGDHWQVDTCSRCEHLRSDHPEPLRAHEPESVGTVLWEATILSIAQPGPSGDTLAFGTVGEGTNRTNIVTIIERDYVRRLVEALADNWAGTGTNCWVSPDKLVYKGDEPPLMAVYDADASATIEGLRPTLMMGQGVIVVESSVRTPGTPVVCTVIYDPTDPKSADCNWALGTRITDVPVNALVLNANWRHWRPAGHPERNGWISKHPHWAKVGSQLP